MHKIGYVHNDIKFENILIGYKNTNKVYLIDFGLCQSYKDSLTGKHVDKINLKFFSGNYMFASLNSCRGNNKSRRDDLESLFYLFIYIYNENNIPWKNFQGTFNQLVIKRLDINVTKSLFKLIPSKTLQLILAYRFTGRSVEICVTAWF